MNNILAIILIIFCFYSNSNGQLPKPDSSECATIYFYRQKAFTGHLKTMRIFSSSVDIVRIDNNSIQKIINCNLGKIDFETKSFEAKSMISLNLEKGKTYFIRCKQRIGFISLRPKLEIIEESIGRAEIKEIDKNQKDED